MVDNRKESLWIRCPICKGKTRTKVYEDTVLVNFPLYCPRCKQEIWIDVAKLKMVLSK
ncbi:MAG: conjugal transfer protein [Clostridia bacterium]|nr:conjugal transfer protein [Clostridia bacterium]